MSIGVIGGQLLGCAVTNDEESDTRRGQQAALNDPFGYGPDARSLQRPAGEDDVDPTDITGGGTANLNKKALKRDWEAVIGK